MVDVKEILPIQCTEGEDERLITPEQCCDVEDGDDNLSIQCTDREDEPFTTPEQCCDVEDGDDAVEEEESS